MDSAGRDGIMHDSWRTFHRIVRDVKFLERRRGGQEDGHEHRHVTAPPETLPIEIDGAGDDGRVRLRVQAYDQRAVALKTELDFGLPSSVFSSIVS